MTSLSLLSAYCAGTLAASLLGIWAQAAVRLTHTRIQLVMSFVAGLVLGVAIYHLLPHSVAQVAGDGPLEAVAWWMTVGIVLMVLLLRVVPLHYHDPIAQGGAGGTDPGRDVEPQSLNWLGIAVGLGLHQLTEGAALGAAVLSQRESAAGIDPLGFGVFLAIALHKPLDAFFLLGMMRVAGVARRNAYFLSAAAALVCPLGALGTYWGIGMSASGSAGIAGRLLAFGAGALICVSLSDLLPEIRFHRHDRVKLTLSFITGLALAHALHLLEGLLH